MNGEFENDDVLYTWMHNGVMAGLMYASGHLGFPKNQEEMLVHAQRVMKAMGCPRKFRKKLEISLTEIEMLERMLNERTGEQEGRA